MAVMIVLGSMDISPHMDDGHVSWDEPQEEDEQLIDNIPGARLGPNMVHEARPQINRVHTAFRRV